MAADIVELAYADEVSKCQLRNKQGWLTKPSGVMSVEAKPPGTSLLSTINHDGPFCGEVVNRQNVLSWDSMWS
jgi:hypothetical protein